MFGPVISSSWRAGDSRQSLAMKGSTSASTTGCRPAVMSIEISVVKAGRQ